MLRFDIWRQKARLRAQNISSSWLNFMEENKLPWSDPEFTPNFGAENKVPWYDPEVSV